ncbi:Nucleolar GTP-binding protein 1 [Rhynchospora pubera]|uniref:Nucleolar GTP-binding protein 1 n=1 Tax=Rhynchospora pubera TaxID=906938 RepID=A0AAV8D7W9_9POAL|nr:Nucleolar GTP-binding protein 1 [Rhynchospora pubera]
MSSTSRAFNLLQKCYIPSFKAPMRSTRRSLGSTPGINGMRSSSICFAHELLSPTGKIVKDGGKRSTAVLSHSPKEEKVLNNQGVGAFQKLPMVMPAIDILSSAQRKARNVSPTKGIANIAKRERNKAAKQLDTLMKELAVPLRTYIENFPNKKYLHPYECSLIELTFGDGNYEQILGRVDSLRKKLISVGKEHASLCAQSSTKREAEERLGEGLKKVQEAFNQGKNALDDLLYVAKSLRAMPVIDPHLPTLCLVGAPNVGKSSLVRILSSGKPEVCNYPFTTRGVLMGHIMLNYERFQVTDTPGLLRRHEDDRNNIERLTLAVLSHLPTAVLYVHDLSGDCGTSADDQFFIYKEIKEKYSNRLWLDVVSKCDLLEDFSTSACISNELDRYKAFGPEGAISVSVTNGMGIEELKDKVYQLLLSQMTQIPAKEG